jgi:hypothetical protein
MHNIGLITGVHFCSLEVRLERGVAAGKTKYRVAAAAAPFYQRIIAPID